MTKTNFTKVEEALKVGLHKMQVQRLLAQASGKAMDEKSQKLHPLFRLIHGIKSLYKDDRAIYKKLGVKKEDLDRLLSQQFDLTKEALEMVKELERKINDYQATQEKSKKPTTSEEIIESERKRHINKRHGIRETWLPLD